MHAHLCDAGIFPPSLESLSMTSVASQFALGSLLRLVLQVDHHNYPTFTLFLEI